MTNPVYVVILLLSYKYLNMIASKCLLYYSRIKEQEPSAVPVRGIYSDSIDSAVSIYIRNMRSGFFKSLGFCTHIMAEVNGIYVDDSNLRIPPYSVFFTEDVIKDRLRILSRVQDVIKDSDSN